jgi:putative transposase
MARPLRIYFNGAWYHVMNRGLHRKNIFHNDAHRYAFLDLLGKTREIYGIEIHAYCLMSNHYHLIVHTPRGNISHAMQYLNSRYAQIVNVSMHRDGPLFKGRFKAILISADEYLIQLSRYIHLNPFKARIINDLSEFKWSSYLAYIGKTRYPEWLTKNEIIQRFGKKSFTVNYNNYMHDKSCVDLDVFYQTSKLKPILGGEGFCREIDEYVRSHSLSAEIVGVGRVVTPPSIEDILNFICKYYGIKQDEIYEINKASGNSFRQIFIYVCREFGGYSLQEIADSLGNIRYKGISKALTRISKNQSQLDESRKIIVELKNLSKVKGGRRDLTP